MKRLCVLLIAVVMLVGCVGFQPPYDNPIDSKMLEDWYEWYLEQQVKPPTPIPTPTPVPTPVPVPTPTPTPTPVPAELVVLDMNKFPEIMSAAGYHHNNPNAQYYVGLCKVYSGWAWPQHETDEVSKAWWFKQQEIWELVDSMVRAAAEASKANPGLHLTVIANDGHDRCGERVGPVIVNRLRELGVDMSRVSLGDVYTP